ncbi:hypothetical protein ASE68_00925 [Agromyces sp. Leaf222]|nr:hypothetical protein ASE68_00925 [Agromyces sp. Leaf222]
MTGGWLRTRTTLGHLATSEPLNRSRIQLSQQIHLLQRQLERLAMQPAVVDLALGVDEFIDIGSDQRAIGLESGERLGFSESFTQGLEVGFLNEV